MRGAFSRGRLREASRRMWHAPIDGVGPMPKHQRRSGTAWRPRRTGGSRGRGWTAQRGPAGSPGRRDPAGQEWCAGWRAPSVSRCVSTPRWVRTSWNVPSTCLSDQATDEPTDEPGEDVQRLGVEISAQQGLGAEGALRIADEHGSGSAPAGSPSSTTRPSARAPRSGGSARRTNAGS